MDEPGAIAVEIAWSPRAGEVLRRRLELPAASTVGDALGRLGAAPPASLAVALWGRLCSPEQVLRDGDRIELCRPLAVDPKEARRVRYRARGSAGRR